MVEKKPEMLIFAIALHELQIELDLDPKLLRHHV